MIKFLQVRKIKRKMKNIQLVRLSSGEELIAEVTKNEDSVFLAKPAIVLPTGQQSIGIVPWMPYANTGDGVSVSDRFVLFVVSPHDDLLAEYNNLFSPLLVPEKPELKLV